ncbi:stage II sporulation protein D [Domibacillus sp. A3M-37]|uniref:stage II sporulation protein D n=1 Tax=Domibacillus sp. A3M-37 TaxID=2962037 RepID=UPI0020B7152F|nr:stage II sporulation protein D [Domibacillus sp. A3M-37]MCP3761465.1 stage II sporulation protein D [Domibacillus sp. A3M-37]
MLLKKPLYTFLFIIIAAIAIPAAGLLLTENKTTPDVQEPTVDVVRSDTQKTESVPLEEYVAGVVAAEMPASFEKEALKAQAVAARTFILTQTLKGLDVTDTVDDQVFKDDEDQKEMWGEDFETNKTKIEAAARETEGEVLVYNGKPITAAFFSSGNGQTENAEEYWQSAEPYLVSVASPWDAAAPNFEQEVVLTKQEVEEKLGVSLPESGSVGAITKKTTGGRIGAITIDGKSFTGRSIRETLGLPSADFQMTVSDGDVVVTTKGYGHGIGMSQYGANGMAKEGKKYEDITAHYYPGAVIGDVQTFLKR